MLVAEKKNAILFTPFDRLIARHFLRLSRRFSAFVVIVAHIFANTNLVLTRIFALVDNKALACMQLAAAAAATATITTLAGSRCLSAHLGAAVKRSVFCVFAVGLSPLASHRASVFLLARQILIPRRRGCSRAFGRIESSPSERKHAAATSRRWRRRRRRRRQVCDGRREISRELHFCEQNLFFFHSYPRHFAPRLALCLDITRFTCISARIISAACIRTTTTTTMTTMTTTRAPALSAALVDRGKSRRVTNADAKCARALV